MQFLFAGELASAVFGNRMGKVIFPRGLVWRCRSARGQTGKVDKPLNPPLLAVYRFDDISRAGLIYFVEFGLAQRFGAAGAVDDVGDIPQGGVETLRVAEGADAHLQARQVRLDESLVAGRAEQRRSREAASAKTIQNMTADKSVRSCEQNLHWFAGRESAAPARPGTL